MNPLLRLGVASTLTLGALLLASPVANAAIISNAGMQISVPQRLTDTLTRG